jgi:uncharacterized protein (DUF3820 family)
MKMPFGKYVGWDLEEIPRQYLEWIVNNLDLYGDLREGIMDILVGVDGELWDVPPRRLRRRHRKTV